MTISDRLFHRFVLQFLMLALKRWGYEPDIAASEGSNLMYRIRSALDK